MKPAPREKSPNLVETVEEATQLLRRLSARAWLWWFGGTLPFVCALLHYWNDMGRSASAWQRLGSSSLGLAVLYVGMKVCHSLFGDALMAIQRDQRSSLALGWKVWLRLIASQTLIHSTMPVVLVLSLVAMFPFGWAYAAYHNVSLLSIQVLRDGGSMRDILNLAIKQSHFRPGQNHGMLMILLIFALLIFFNLFIGLLTMAILSTSISGSESFMTRNPWVLMSSGVLAALTCFTYLLTGPLVKASYALRCFYGQSRTNGEDLLVRFRRAGAAATLVLISLVLTLAPPQANAQQSKVAAQAQEQKREHRVQQLDESIRRTLQQDDFQWRLPRDSKRPEGEGGIIADFSKAISEGINDIVQKLAGWVGDGIVKYLKDFLRKLRNNKSDDKDETQTTSAWISSLEPLMWVLLTILGIALAALLYRQWRRLPPPPAKAPSAAPEINLESDAVVATQLPESEWMRLAREKIEGGDYRLAMRALFLATLAHLGERRLIAVSRWKSNGDYKRELSLRARDRQPLREAFEENVRTFDWAWYGWHDVSKDLLDRFMTSHNLIVSDGS